MTPQEQYASRPYATRIETRYFSATLRFDTLAEAIGYLHDQYNRVSVEHKLNPTATFDAKRSFITLPGDCRVACCEFVGDTIWQ